MQFDGNGDEELNVRSSDDGLKCRHAFVLPGKPVIMMDQVQDPAGCENFPESRPRGGDNSRNNKPSARWWGILLLVVLDIFFVFSADDFGVGLDLRQHSRKVASAYVPLPDNSAVVADGETVETKEYFGSGGHVPLPLPDNDYTTSKDYKQNVNNSGKEESEDDDIFSSPDDDSDASSSNVADSTKGGPSPVPTTSKTILPEIGVPDRPISLEEEEDIPLVAEPPPAPEIPPKQEDQRANTTASYSSRWNPDPNNPPNILMIAIDDMNDWVGFLGKGPAVVNQKPGLSNRTTATPNMDRLAYSPGATIFEHAYVASSVCLPSRSAALTGVRPTTSGIYRTSIDWWNIVGGGAGSNRNPNLIEYFQNEGYETIGTGKIFHESPYGPGSETWTRFEDPRDKGFPLGHDKDCKRREKGMCHHGVRKLCNAGLNFGPSQCRGEDDLASRWIAQLLQQRDQNPQQQPFFMALGLRKPHTDWTVPQKYFDRFPLDQISLPQTLQNDLADVPQRGYRLAKSPDLQPIIAANNMWKEAVQAYLAAVSYTDDNIGRVMDALNSSSNLRDNTIVVLWSDHGYHLGEKTKWRKSTLWEDATHIPYVIRVPGADEERGAVVRHPVDLMSMYPTLVELAFGKDKPLKKTVEGHSVVPLIKNPSTRGREWGHSALMAYKRYQAVRIGDWRYIQYTDGTEEMYRHSADENEWYNLADDPAYERELNALRQEIVQNPAKEAPKMDKYYYYY